MKKVLIMVISSQHLPYDKMADTSSETWDSIQVEGVETVFYFGAPLKDNTGNRIYFDIPEAYRTMSSKTMYAFQWALENKEFDYVARINSSTYVNKKALIEHVQSLPNEKVFKGMVVKSGSSESNDWIWGAFFLLSADVVRKALQNKSLLDRSLMDDVGLSRLLNGIGIYPSDGMGCSIDRNGDKWRAICYGSESFEFTDFADIVKAKQHWGFRVKQDLDRTQDEFVMRELFKYLS